jgi:hypothetical protein
MHTNMSSTTPTDNKLSLQHLPTPLPPPHPLKLPHKRLLHLLIPRPRLAHLLHAQRSNNSETQRAERGLLLTDSGIGRDADGFEEAEVGGVAILPKVSRFVLSIVEVLRGGRTGWFLPLVIHLNLHQEPALGPDETFAESFFALAAGAQERDLLRQAL